MPTSPKFRKKHSGGRTHRRTKGRKWRRIRQIFLDSDPLHRLCAACLKEGRTAETEIVDHKIPVSQAPELEFELSNLQGLCRTHSDLKTAAENRGQRW